MTFNKPKRLTGLNQKVRGQGEELSNLPTADNVPPADRRSLTRSDTHAERGKPVVLPRRGKVCRKTNPQDSG